MKQENRETTIHPPTSIFEHTHARTHTNAWRVEGRDGKWSTLNVNWSLGRSKSHNAQTCNRLTKSKCLFAVVFSHARDSKIFAIPYIWYTCGMLVVYRRFTKYTHKFLASIATFTISQRMCARVRVRQRMAVATKQHTDCYAQFRVYSYTPNLHLFVCLLVLFDIFICFMVFFNYACLPAYRSRQCAPLQWWGI